MKVKKQHESFAPSLRLWQGKRMQKLSKYIFPHFFFEISAILLLAPFLLFIPGLFLYFAIFTAYAYLVLWIGNKLFRLLNRISHQTLFLSLSHALLIFPLVFFLSAAIGGTSMAVADGEAGSTFSRYLLYFVQTVAGTILCLVFFMPWSLFWVCKFKSSAHK